MIVNFGPKWPFPSTKEDEVEKSKYLEWVQTNGCLYHLCKGTDSYYMAFLFLEDEDAMAFKLKFGL